MGNILQRNQVEEACILEQTILAMMEREVVSRAWEEVWRLGGRRGSLGNGSESLLCCRSERVCRSCESRLWLCPYYLVPV